MKNYVVLIFFFIAFKAYAIDKFVFDIKNHDGSSTGESIELLKIDESGNQSKYLMTTEFTLGHYNAISSAINTYPGYENVSIYADSGNVYCRIHWMKDPQYPLNCINKFSILSPIDPKYPINYSISVALNTLSKLNNVNNIDWTLPTFAEWKHAALLDKNGNETEWLPDPANSVCYRGDILKVASKNPTGIGFFDIVGNVSELLMEKDQSRGGHCRGSSDAPGSAYCFPGRGYVLEAQAGGDVSYGQCNVNKMQFRPNWGEGMSVKTGFRLLIVKK